MTWSITIEANLQNIRRSFSISELVSTGKPISARVEYLYIRIELPISFKPLWRNSRSGGRQCGPGRAVKWFQEASPGMTVKLEAATGNGIIYGYLP
jgi:hypothetical protein